jgi:hypothetical protein
MYSTPVRGTSPKKNRTTLNWWEYWIGHCWMTGWQTIRCNFRVWADLMGSSYADYALPRTVEDPEQECIEWFWVGLNDDDVYPKEFLESLMEMMDRIDRGEEKLIPLDEGFFDRLKELTDDIDVNLNERLEED